MKLGEQWHITKTKGRWSTIGIDLLEIKDKNGSKAETLFERIKSKGSPYGPTQRQRDYFRRKYGSKWASKYCESAIHGYGRFYLYVKYVPEFIKICEELGIDWKPYIPPDLLREIRDSRHTEGMG